MLKQSVIEKLKLELEGSFHVLDPKKVKRMNAKTLFIPSPEDVAKAIKAILSGTTRTITELRQDLANMGNADTACPAKTLKYWKWMAAAQDEPEDTDYQIPWWRVLKDGKPSRHMPGGVEHQIARLQAEGVEI